MLFGETFLVTGATGRLGCALVPRLEELGATVLPLVCEGYPDKPKRVRWVAKSEPIIIRDEADLTRLPACNYVINLHWQVDRKLPFSKQVLYEFGNNIHQLAFLWDWLSEKGLERFVNVSSVKIFSRLNRNPISAETEPRPLTPYGIAKVTAEKFFDARFDGSFPVVHLRLCSVASCGEHPSQLMSQLCVSALENRRIRINTGHLVYVVHIDEAIDLMINAALNGRRGRYIVTPEGMKAEDMARTFEAVSGMKLDVEYLDLAPGVEDPVFVSDREALWDSWTRCTSIELMIQKIIRESSGREQYGPLTNIECRR